MWCGWQVLGWPKTRPRQPGRVDGGLLCKRSSPALLLFSIGAMLWFISGSIVRGTVVLLERVGEMATGAADLTRRIPVTSGDEIGKLAGLINAVIQRIHDLIARARVATIQLNSTATEIAASANQQIGTMQGFAASSNEIAAAVKQISASGKGLVRTMEDVDSRAAQASSLAGSGRAGLSEMQSTMQQLSDASGSISGKLSTIREKASNINVVVTTITKVADQTNLLSINAAIEAEKAGECGPRLSGGGPRNSSPGRPDRRGHARYRANGSSHA